MSGCPERAARLARAHRAALHGDLGAFWRGVCEAPALRAVSHGPALGDACQAALGVPVEPFDFLWLRTMVEGRASPLHLDHVYMNRGTERLVTAWIPLGDVPLAAGPLVVVEGSHRFADVAARYRGVDVDRDGLPGSFPDDAIAFARARGVRLSCDVRWQAAGEARDERWFGDPPPGHGGAGYGGLNGARPLGEAYIAR